ncbi:MAG: segregation/condensation protein A [Clostridiales bacterium]|jgi:segregation and condensation protein A|nr:segregation/condensation protein A [Clostridiales bacterium]
MEGLIIKTEAFEGPFELLFHLLDKNQMEISDIPIAELTSQYIAYLESVTDMDSLSSFLLMAATLTEIKSAYLLPKKPKAAPEGEEQDPRERLVAMLLEYKRFKEVTGILREKYEAAAGSYEKGPEPEYLDRAERLPKPRAEEALAGVRIDRLCGLFADLMRKRAPSEDEPLFAAAAPEVFTVEDKIREIERILRERKSFLFGDFFARADKEEMVAAFCAVLELVRQNKAEAGQDGNFKEIVVAAVPA